MFERPRVHENLWIAARSRHPARRRRSDRDDLIERLALAASPSQTVGTLAHGSASGWRSVWSWRGGPKLVLLDEPTAGMAPDEVARTAPL